MIYNSALRRNASLAVASEAVEYFAQDGNVGRRWNIVTEAPPRELYQCDVFYCEPPFPSGLTVFDQRAGEKTGSYSDFATGFARFWSDIPAPKYSVINSALLKKLPEPHAIVAIKLNGVKENLACWHAAVPPANMTTLEFCEWLGHRHRRMADITCGYGMQLMHFKKARSGNTFVGTDYDPHCIGVLRRLLNEDL